MGTRRRGREITLQLLYKIDITGLTPDSALNMYKNNFSVKEEAWTFASALTLGICSHTDEIDILIERQSEHWKMGRMSLTDRNILRMAVYEILHEESIPAKVTINEAIELGKKYGSEDSGAFINGILDKIHKNKDLTCK